MVVVLLVMLVILCLITVVVLGVAQLVDMVLLLHRVKVVMVVLQLQSQGGYMLLLMHLRRSSNVMKPVVYPVTMHVYTYQICLRM